MDWYKPIHRDVEAMLTGFLCCRAHSRMKRRQGEDVRAPVSERSRLLCERQSDRNRLFDAVVRPRPLVAVNTLDLGEYPGSRLVGEEPRQRR